MKKAVATFSLAAFLLGGTAVFAAPRTEAAAKPTAAAAKSKKHKKTKKHSTKKVTKPATMPKQ